MGDVAPIETRVSEVEKSTLYDYISSELVYYLQDYYTLILVVFGLVGNAISLSVFRCSSMWKLSTGRYLSALALTDSFFLVQLLIAWMDMVDLSDMFNWSGLCQASVYTSYVSCNLSAWLVVAFTVERLVAVKWPLRRGAYPASRATTIVQVLSAISLTVNLPVLRFAAATPHCNLDPRYRSHADAFNMLDTIISFTIPLAAIVLMNILICAGLLRAQRQRRSLVVNTCPDIEQDQQRRRGEADSYKVNAMLLTVSTVFVLLNLPAYSIRVLAYKFDLKGTTNERWITLQHVTLSMFHTNFGINLLLYCVSGSNFRNELAQNWLSSRMRSMWGSIRQLVRNMARSMRPRRQPLVRRPTPFRPHFITVEPIPPPLAPPRPPSASLQPAARPPPYVRRRLPGFWIENEGFYESDLYYENFPPLPPPPLPPRGPRPDVVRRYVAGLGGCRFIEGYERGAPRFRATATQTQAPLTSNDPPPAYEPPPYNYRASDHEMVFLPGGSQ